jgi:hypothetical protein
MNVSGSTMSNNVTVSLKRTPGFAAEIRGFPPNREFMPKVLALRRNQAPSTQKGTNPAAFYEFPVKFPVSRELRSAKPREMSIIYTASVARRAYGKRK